MVKNMESVVKVPRGLCVQASIFDLQWFMAHLTKTVLKGKCFNTELLHSLKLLFVKVFKFVHRQVAIPVQIHAAKPTKINVFFQIWCKNRLMVVSTMALGSVVQIQTGAKIELSFFF